MCCRAGYTYAVIHHCRLCRFVSWGLCHVWLCGVCVGECSPFGRDVVGAPRPSGFLGRVETERWLDLPHADREFLVILERCV